MGDFFAFRTMITSTAMRIGYFIGAIGISLTGLAMMTVSGTGSGMLTGLALLFFGNLIWRIFCETSILLFSIHDVLVEIARTKPQPPVQQAVEYLVADVP